jgi:acyl-coenzyme A synthetase/AMP-(fatty) acid ligase
VFVVGLLVGLGLVWLEVEDDLFHCASECVGSLAGVAAVHHAAVSCLTDAAHWQIPSVQTFTALAASVHRTANTFAALGIGRRDAVAIISVNCESMLWAILGAQAAGIAAPINPGLSAEHVTKLARLARAKVLVVLRTRTRPGRMATRPPHRRRHRRHRPARAAARRGHRPRP